MGRKQSLSRWRPQWSNADIRSVGDATARQVEALAELRLAERFAEAVADEEIVP